MNIEDFFRSLDTQEGRDYLNYLEKCVVDDSRKVEVCSKLVHTPEALSKSILASQKTRAERYGTCASYMHVPEVRKKAGDTIAQKYGGDRAGQLHTREAVNKRNETMMKRYGKKGFILSEESRQLAVENSKKTALARYGKLGNAQTFQIPEVRKRAVENSKKARTEKYGSPTGAMQTKEACEKRKRTLARRKEIMNTDKFKKWWQEHESEYRLRSKGVRYFEKWNSEE